MSVGTFTELAIEHRGEVLWLTLNRPKAANAMNLEMMAQIVATLTVAAVDSQVRAVVLTGAGERVFSAGVDLRPVPGMPEGVLSRKRGELLQQTMLAILDFEKPLITAINGIASGGGFLVSLVTDMIVASAEATFVLSEIDVGITTYPGLLLLSELSGGRVASDLVLTGRRMSAEEAKRRGLVAQVAPRGELAERAQELAAALGAKPPTAIAMNKRFLRGRIRESLLRAFAASQADKPELYASGEPQAAAAAFFARQAAKKEAAGS